MARQKRQKKAGGKATAQEFRFRIDAFSPDTMPMARLAEYMAQLAAILGETKSVHLVALEPGSTVLVHRVEREAVPKVRDRTSAVRRGDAPRDAQVAYRTVNRFLREDNASAVLIEKKRGPTVLRFPGREESAETFPSVRQQASLEGIVARVGGTDETIPVLLLSENQPIAGCYTTRDVAKRLAQRLFEPVRLHGHGTWMRDAEGVWTLKAFKIETFEVLETATLTEAVEKLRAVKADWGKNALADLEIIRHGKAGHGRT